MAGFGSKIRLRSCENAIAVAYAENISVVIEEWIRIMSRMLVEILHDRRDILQFC
jgi:hypothetical protein